MHSSNRDYGLWWLLLIIIVAQSCGHKPQQTEQVCEQMIDKPPIIDSSSFNSEQFSAWTDSISAITGIGYGPYFYDPSWPIRYSEDGHTDSTLKGKMTLRICGPLLTLTCRAVRSMSLAHLLKTIARPWVGTVFLKSKAYECPKPSIFDYRNLADLRSAFPVPRR